MSPPVYLSHPLVMAVVSALLDRADRAAFRPNPRAASVRLDRSEVPSWRAGEDVAAKEFAWNRLRDLHAAGYLALSLSRAAQHAGAPWREVHRIVLTLTGEERFRLWLRRPRPEASASREWRDAVQMHPGLSATLRASLAARPVVVGKRKPAEILERLLAASRTLPAGTPRRVVSARTFWGHSKVLDGRDDLLAILGGPAAGWRKHPLQVLVHQPQHSPAGVLFVENIEAFDAIVTGVVPMATDWTLLFSSGFKAGTQRILEPGGTRWYSAVEAPGRPADEMLQVVRGAASRRWPAFFWGDLDYTGLAILRDLRTVIPHARAWEPGYRRLRDSLIAGEGHLATESRKVRQRDPGRTGCDFADSELLPRVRQLRRFMDQEAICYADDWREL